MEIARVRGDWNRDSKEIAKILRQLKTDTDALSKLEDQTKLVREELAKLAAEKLQALEDMRSGDFCSGCGATRSAFLAKGEPFPHPNQQIRAATDEELRKAAADYDERIQRVRDRVAKLEGKLKKDEGDLSSLLHRLRVLVPTYHANIIKERDLRELTWSLEKQGIEDSLETLNTQIKTVTRQTQADTASEAREALSADLRILQRQMTESAQRASAAESRAKQQAQTFGSTVKADMASLSTLASSLPNKFGLPGGWYLGQMLRTPARSVDYLVLMVRRFDGSASEGSVRDLLGGSPAAPHGHSGQPSSPASMKDLLEGN